MKPRLWVVPIAHFSARLLSPSLEEGEESVVKRNENRLWNQMASNPGSAHYQLCGSYPAIQFPQASVSLLKNQDAGFHYMVWEKVQLSQHL
jgi:hypothetical protein